MRPTTIKDRYQLRQVIGQGGMGVVYKAYDNVMRREVAIKTLRDSPSQMVLDLFYRECGVLAGMVHPNIVEIFDMGEYDDEGVSRPFFVMPLLPGSTLYDLIYPAREPLSVERCVEICAQTCRGLQAAHDRGLLHRDIKPRNIFVIDDYSIKIIDFGVAHLLDSQSATGIKGTLEYMAPEQIAMKALSPSTDVFALGTVCYEMLTATQPFRRDTDVDTVTAVLQHHPPVVSDLNPRVPRLFAQVISKAMAKDARSRFSSGHEFAEALQKAFRNEPLRAFDPAGARVRLDRARRCLDHRDLTFASDILRELEAEGQFQEEVASLRGQVDKALNAESANQLLAIAKRCFEEEEYSLALRKVQEALDLDATHPDAGSLKQQIENILTQQKVDELLQTAGQHLDNVQFTSARQALNEVLKLSPEDTRARLLLAEADERHKQFLRHRQEQEKLYQVARGAWIDGDISVALENLERLAELCRSSRDARERVVEYKDFYKLVRTEHDALITSYNDAQRLLAEDDLPGAMALAGHHLGKHPGHAGFRELRRRVEDRIQQKRIAFIDSVEAQVEAEPDLDARGSILEEALQHYPEETRLTGRLEAVRAKQAAVGNIVERAQSYEEEGEYTKALREWESLRSVHAEYPGLAGQIERVKDAHEQARAAAKARLLKRANDSLGANQHAEAASLLRELQADFSGDSEVADLESRIRDAVDRQNRSDALFAEGQRFAREGRFADARNALTAAFEIGRNRPGFAVAVLDSLAAAARRAVDVDWRAAEELVRALSSLDPSYQPVSQLTQAIENRKTNEAIERAVAEARELQSSGDPKAAAGRVEAALQTYAEDTRLRSLNAELLAAIDLHQLRTLREECERADLNQIPSLMQQARDVVERHKDDAEFSSTRDQLEEQFRDLIKASSLVEKNQTSEASAHAAFAAILREAEDRGRQIAADFVSDVKRRVAAEPRVEQRLEVLQDALNRYPGEPYFQQELALVREEDKLIRSIVNKARAQEQAQNYGEALEHWTSLRTIYKHYPGLEGEIARVAAVFERRAKSQKLICEAQELSGSGQYAAIGDKLDSAFRTAGDDAILRSQVLDAFVDHARTALKRDWAATDGLLEHAARLESGFQAPGDITTELEQRRGEHGIQQCVTEAQDLENSGNLAAALQRIDDGLAVFSNEPRLVERKQTLERGIEHARRETEKRKHLGELREIEHASRSTADPRTLRELSNRAARIAQHTDATDEMRSAAATLQNEMGAIEQARDLIAKDQIAEALSICGEFLTSHPEHAAFSALKREAEDRERHRASAFLGDVERRVAVEPRIEQRVAILEDALKRYPDELYFQQELALAREDQKIIRSVVDRARAQEQAQNYADALEHWNSLRTMYKHYPGLEDEIARNTQLLEQARAAKKAKVVEQIADATQTGSYTRARDLIRSAETEFPHDEELAALRTKVQKAEECRAEAQKLIADAQDLSASQRFTEAGGKLWLAFGSAEGHAALKKQVLDMYLKHARTAMKTDWQAADALLQQAIKLDTGYRIPEELASKIEQRRREHRIQEILTEAQGLEASGNLPAALAKIEAGLAEYPQEPRLLERKDALQSAAQRKRIEALRDIEHESRTMVDARLLDALSQRAAALSKQGGGTDEIASRIAGIREELDAIARARDLLAKGQTAEVVAICSEYLAGSPKHTAFSALKREAEERERQRTSSRVAVDSLGVNGGKAIEPARPEPFDEAPADTEQGPPDPVPAPPKRVTKSWLYAAAGVVAVIALIWLGRISSGRSMGELVVTSSPAGASVEINGKKCVTPNCRLEFQPGTYELKAEKEGYRGIVRSVVVVSGRDAQSLQLTLNPVAPAIQIATNLEFGLVTMDGSSAGSLREGQLVLEGAAGNHVIGISSGDVTGTVKYTWSPGEVPALPEPLQVTNAHAVVITALDGKGTLFCNCGEQPVTIDGVDVGHSSPSGLPLTGLTPGSHELKVGSGDSARTHVVGIGNGPALNLLLSIARGSGTLVVDAGEDSVSVYVNGHVYPRQTSRGLLRIPLDAGAHSIRVEKNGFQSPPPQNVSIGKEEKRVVFKLQPKPAVLQIAGGSMPRVTLSIDGRVVGATGADGSFSTEVAPGSHMIEFAKDKNRERMQRQFAAGETVRLTASDIPQLRQELARLQWEKARTIADFERYRQMHPNGQNYEEALTKMSQLEWDFIDKKNRNAVEAFARRYGATPLGRQAQQIAGDLTRSQGSGESISPADRRAVLETLTRYQSAYNGRNVDAVLAQYPTLNRRALRITFNRMVTNLQIQPTGEPALAGDRIFVVCKRTSTTTFNDNSQPPQTRERTVRVTFSKSDGRWIIDSIAE